MAAEQQDKVADQRPSMSVNAEANDKNHKVQHEQGEESMTSSSHSAPVRTKRPSSADDLEKYNYKVAVESWDQIGSLASEVASSVLSQLAEGMSEQIREEDRTAKRRKMHHTSFAPVVCPSEPTVVSSDDEASSVDELPPISRSLSLKIDRMGRMSKYMMQIERHHRLLRDEMDAIREDGL
jgi:hypothetical protein